MSGAGGGLRLRGEVRGTALALDVPPDGGVLGSDPDCELPIFDPTISRRHAELRPSDGGLEIRDLGSTNGTWIGGRRIETAEAAPGSEILFGRVKLTLDGVAAADREIAVRLPPAGDPGEAGETPSQAPTVLERRGAPALAAETTLGLGPLDALATDALPRLLRLFHDYGDLAGYAQAAGAVLIASLPLAVLEIRGARGGGLLYRGERGEVGDSVHVVEVERGRVAVRAGFDQPSLARWLAPVVESIALLVDLAGRRALPERAPPAETEGPPPLPEPATLEPALCEIYRRAARVAPGRVGVLILGESGTGKEVLTRYVHRASGRRELVALNCAALPRDLLEAELFGIEKGTATGVEPRPGKIELAHEGTLFLDEIGDMSLDTQAKILRVLQEGEVYRLGASRPRPADTRVISATNRPVRALVEEGRFRLDLYHRIAGWVVELPPLRERRADLPNLALHFLAEEGRRLGRSFRGISKAALDALLAAPWPGNVRQLQQEISRAALFLDHGGVLEATDLSAEVREAADEAAGPGAATDLSSRLEAFERREIERALAACDGQVAAAADRLGVHRATLYRRIKALGIAHDAA